MPTEEELDSQLVDEELDSPDDQASAESDASISSDEGSEDSSPEDEPKKPKQRDLLAERSRELHQTRAQVTQLQKAVQDTAAQVNALLEEREAALTEQQKRQHAAKMAAIKEMEPEKQIDELWKVVGDLTAPRQPVKAEPGRQPTQAEIEAQVRAHLANINASFGLEDDDALTGYEAGLDGHPDERSWLAAAVALAKQKKADITAGEGGSVPKGQTEIERLRAENAALKQGKTPPTVAGAGRSLSPGGAARKAVTTEDIQKKNTAAIASYKPAKGVKAVRKQLEANRDILKERASKEMASIS